jgi:large subunit ribosomal protein L9
MKVILQKSIAKVGKKGEVIKVSDGYGRNYLFPRNLAVPATPGAIKDAKLHQAKKVKAKNELVKQADSILASLADVNITLSAKAGESGKLFGSVNSQMIADAVNKDLKIKLPADIIDLEKDLKEIGDHKIKIKLAPEKETQITLKITPETGK